MTADGFMDRIIKDMYVDLIKHQENLKLLCDDVKSVERTLYGHRRLKWVEKYRNSSD